MNEELCRGLIRAALSARRKAYAPYSHYLVGAALLCRAQEKQETETIREGMMPSMVPRSGAVGAGSETGGIMIPGCNIENASYGVTVCAERTALFSAIAQGYRRFDAIAIVSGPEDATTLPWPSPCGICRQALREFADPAQFSVILARSESDWRCMTLDELLPESFGPDYL